LHNYLNKYIIFNETFQNITFEGKTRNFTKGKKLEECGGKVVALEYYSAELDSGN
jgi:hypothetical protein